MKDKLRIKFEMTDEAGNNYISATTTEVFTDIGETDLSVAGQQFNIFLKQCGYVRKNDYIFMEDVTEKEYDALADYLQSIRSKKDA